jgi:hypothetical protein
MDARELLYGMPASVIVTTCAVSMHTARRWKRTGRCPAPAARLLELVIRGELGVLNPAWLGFKLIRDHLVTPAGFEVAPGEISSLPYKVALIRALELELSIPTQRKLLFPP